MVATGHTLTWTDLWADCAKRLGSSDESRAIIEHASGRSGSSWLITMTSIAPEDAIERVDKMMQRRLDGEPIQYILGRWAFRQLDLVVDQRVLIPRPETEQVVSAAMEMIRENKSPLVADLGTGSGAIALSIAQELPMSTVWATDLSPEALDVARLNASHAVPSTVSERVTFVQGSWLDALPMDMSKSFDLIVSNPPYIADGDSGVAAAVRNWEPANALFAGSEGLDAISTIVSQAPSWLTNRGALVVEIGPAQADAVSAMAWNADFFSVDIGVDLTGRRRWLVATMRS